jgi:hypothetical protein
MSSSPGLDVAAKAAIGITAPQECGPDPCLAGRIIDLNTLRSHEPFKLSAGLQTMRYLALALTACLLAGCAVLAVADLAVTSVVTVAKVGVKTVGAAVDAVIPDKKSDADKSKGR